MRRSSAIVAVVAVTAGLVGLGPAGAALAVPITGPQDGVLVVQLQPVAGHPSLVGIAVTVENEDYQDTSGTTDAAGRVTLSGLNTDASLYTVSITSVPDAGVATVAPVSVHDPVPVTSTPTTFEVPVGVGGTLTGLLVDHTGAPLVGAVVSAYQSGSWDTGMSTTTDAEGRYTMSGLEPGVIRFDSQTAGGKNAEWLGWSVAQTATTAAQTRRVPTTLVHSDYDLQVEVQTLRAPEPVSGAIVRLRNTATGASFDERTDFTVHWDHLVSFDVPSGDYTIELITRATATTPAQSWWLPASSTYLTSDASRAGSFVVAYGTDDYATQYLEAVLLAS
jgi:hypothetical protein